MEGSQKQVAIIAGGTSAMSSAIEDRLASAGFSVAWLRGADAIGHKADMDHGEHVDCLDHAAVSKWMEAVADRYGNLDCLVHLPETSSHLAWLDTSAREFDRIVARTLQGSFIVSQCAARIMAGRGGGSLVHIVAALGGTAPSGSVQAACQAAILQLVRVMAVDLASLRIRANAIVLPVPEGPGERSLAHGRGGSHGEADSASVLADLAATALFLSTAEASYINGHVLQMSSSLDVAGYDRKECGHG